MESLESFYKTQRKLTLQIIFRAWLPSSHKHLLSYAEFSAFTFYSLAGIFVFNTAFLCKKKTLICTVHHFC